MCWVFWAIKLREVLWKWELDLGIWKIRLGELLACVTGIFGHAGPKHLVFVMLRNEASVCDRFCAPVFAQKTDPSFVGMTKECRDDKESRDDKERGVVPGEQSILSLSC